MSNFHTKKIKKITQELNVNVNTGLPEKEIKKRIIKFGLNELPKEKVPTWIHFVVNQFKSPLIYILGFAGIVSLLLSEYIDFWIIFATLMINAGIGFFQEYKANSTLQKLKELVHLKARVLRNNKEKEIDVEKIVPGDILIFEAGNKISCDGRIIEANNLSISEASLTGESIPSEKSEKIIPDNIPLADRENMIYMGTQVATGNGKAIVTTTGSDTELGKIATLVKETKSDHTPLQKKIARLSRSLSIILVAITVLIFFIGILRQHSFFEMLITSVALAVAAIPEGLPAAVAIVLALAMQKILKRKGLVKRLVGAETLGSTSVICTDKTGTLTKGEMAVSKIITWDENTKPGKSLALKISALNNDATIENPDDKFQDWKVLGTPTEKALLLVAAGAGYQKIDLEKKHPRLDEIPFSGELKYMATLHKVEQENLIYIKGAPEKIIGMSSQYYSNGNPEKLTSQKKSEILDQLIELTSKGLRVIAVGYKNHSADNIKKSDINEIILVGLIALKDPLRKEAKETIRLCKQAGIKIVIITGDHKLTTKTIALELGFEIKDKNILEGADLDKMSDEELNNKITNVKIFARIEPKHKVRIVDAWQAREEVVAMVGDGVNDAPALKSADIGVAVGSGTDVTKETSDIIILDNNLATLVAAVEEGRVAFDNIKKVSLYLLADTFSEVLLIGTALLLGFPLPVLAAQILWINIVEDGLPSIALAFEKGEKAVMKEKPRKLKESILDPEMKILIFAIGIISDLILIGLYWWLLKQGVYDLAHIRSIMFAALSLDSLMYVFASRSLRFTIFKKNPLSNKFLLFGVLFGGTAIVAGIYIPFLQTILKTVPLSLDQWIIPIILAIFKLILIEAVKEIFIIKRRRENNNN